jgi:predicted DNA binding CopG/RHH family protein
MKPTKRHVIPIDFPEDDIKALKAEAEKMGLKVSTYIRHLVATHQSRELKLKIGKRK